MGCSNRLKPSLKSSERAVPGPGNPPGQTPKGFADEKRPVDAAGPRAFCRKARTPVSPSGPTVRPPSESPPFERAAGTTHQILARPSIFSPPLAEQFNKPSARPGLYDGIRPTNPHGSRDCLGLIPLPRRCRPPLVHLSPPAVARHPTVGSALVSVAEFRMFFERCVHAKSFASCSYERLPSLKNYLQSLSGTSASRPSLRRPAARTPYCARISSTVTTPLSWCTLARLTTGSRSSWLAPIRSKA